MEGSNVWRRWIAAPLAAVLIALAAIPTAQARQSPTIVTINDPAGARTITAAQAKHWLEVARASAGGANTKTSKRQLQAQVLQLLIGFAWIEGEARAQGITITDAEVQLTFEEQLQQAFPKLSDFRKFLRTSHQTRKDILDRVRLDLLANAIRDRVAATAPAVTEADIDAFIAERGPIELPERRDLRLVVTRTRAQARQARSALESGATWSQVARRYALDEGARLRDVTKDDLDPRIRRAVFRARRGRLVGPLKTPYGYYIVRVSRIRPASTLPAREQRKIAREILASEAGDRAMDTFVVAFTATWKSRTVCAAAYDWHSDCGNWDGTKAVLGGSRQTLR